MEPIIINRRYYDEYFYDLCCQTAKQVDIPVYLEHLTSSWIDQLDNKKSALVFLPDYLTDGLQYNRWDQNQLQKLEQRTQLTIIATSVNNAHLDWNIANLYFIHTGSDMFFQSLQYPQLSGCTDKNFEQAYHWVCLCRLPRYHRVIVLCTLLGLDLKQGYVSIGPHEFNNIFFDNWYNKPLDLDLSIIDLLRSGWKKFLQMPSFVDKSTYNVPPNHNALNFDLNLRHIYNNCALEIVTETTFFNHGQFVSEKYLNSIYGCNFPIVISNAGTVSYLRDNGFDVFDDVVDHSYDSESNPVLRVYHAVQKNMHLLKDRNYALTKWNQCKDRFIENLNFARNKIYKKFKKKFTCSLKLLL